MYTCDECERSFGGPMWHCQHCGRHTQAQYRTCRFCHSPCHFPEGWLEAAQHDPHARLSPFPRPIPSKLSRKAKAKLAACEALGNHPDLIAAASQLGKILGHIETIKKLLQIMLQHQGVGVAAVRAKAGGLEKALNGIARIIDRCRPTTLCGCVSGCDRCRPWGAEGWVPRCV